MGTLREALRQREAASQHPEQSEEPRRWTILLCSRCGLPTDGPIGRGCECLSGDEHDPPAHTVEVVEATSYERVKAERDEARDHGNLWRNANKIGAKLAEDARAERDAALATIEPLTTRLKDAVHVLRLSNGSPEHEAIAIREVRRVLASALADHPGEGGRP